MGFYRKLVVDGKTYKYNIGKNYTKIVPEEGKSTLACHTETVGADLESLLNDRNYRVSVWPSDIEKYIRAKKL